MSGFSQASFSTESFSVSAFAFDLPTTDVKLPDSIKWGYGPMVTPEKRVRGKTRQQRQNEVILLALIH
jgi:hypothetical protein